MSDKFWVKHYGKLVGWKISSVAYEDQLDEDEDMFPEGLYGLVLTKGKKKKIAWILRDPEGNGEGFLEISPIN